MWKLSRLVAISMMVSCSGPPGPGPTSPGATVQLVGDDECPKLGCGLNGSWLGDNLPFRELDLGPKLGLREGRMPNQAHLVIESFTKRDDDPRTTDDDLAIDVVNDDLLGRRRHGCPLRDGDLIGTKITLAPDAVRRAAGHPERYFLTIENVTFTGFWTEPCAFNTAPDAARPDRTRHCPTSDTVPLYTINFVSENGNEKRNLCDPLAAPGEEGQGRVVIFRGDRYHEPLPPGEFRRPGYTVESDPTSTWFNIACEGTAIAKLHLLRHTAASDPDPRSNLDDCDHTISLPPDLVATGPIAHARRTTKDPQRTALLKMLTADYCGIGFPFTENGHRLSYAVQQPWQVLFPRDNGSAVPFTGVNNASIDALWNQDGAVCLAVPRLTDQELPSHLEDRIRKHCPDQGQPGLGVAAPTRPDLFAGKIGSVRRCGSRVTLDHWSLGLATLTGSYAISANPEPFHVIDNPNP